MKKLFILSAITSTLLLAVSCQKEHDLVANLVDGPTLNDAFPEDATSVVFEYNSNETSTTILSMPNSPTPIYGYLEGSVWHVCTAAKSIYANPNCFQMFYTKTNLTSIDFGNSFNTANVTDMGAMFDGCSSLTSLDLSSFNMSNVTYKDSTCYNLSTTSGYCTITCPLAVQNEMQSGTGFPTSEVEFSWVRP